jgi:hypothetical protein
MPLNFNEKEVLIVGKKKEKFDKIWRTIKGSDNALEWIAVILIVGFSMFTMFYADFQGTMNYAFQTVKQVMNGNIGSIKYIATHSYGLTMAILLMIWVLPFYPLTTLMEGFEFYESVAGAVWGKLFLSIISIFFIVGIYKIAKLLEVKEKNRKWIPIFVLTSAFYFVPVVEIGQCDIIGLTFMMWGLYYFLKEDTKRFLIFFAIAIPMKYFAIMIFIPLVLLHEKNPVKIILQGISGGSLLVVNMIYRKICFGTFLGEFTSSALSTMTGSDVANTVEEASDGTVQVIREIVADINTIEDYFGTYIGNSTLFVVVFIMICILAYAISENYKQWALYIPCLVYTSFITLTPTNVYWSVLMLPFMALVIFSNEKQLRLSMILETIAGWAFMFIACFDAAWVVGGESTFDYLFLRNMAKGSDLHTFLEYEIGMDKLLPYANSAYVACMLGLLLLNMPCLANRHVDNENAKFDRWIIWGRTVILYIWVLLLIYLMIIR